jgi:acyl transferase domain-containing protein
MLSTSHAFHSSMMDPIVERFKELAGKVRQQKPRLPWISTVTGEWMNEQGAPDGSYWASQVRHTVRFGHAAETAIKGGATAFLEVGPGQALTQLVRQQPSNPQLLTALSSLGPYKSTLADIESILTSLGRLWLIGIEPDWSAFYETEKRMRLALPTYPFERKSYWVAPPAQVRAAPFPGISNAVERDGVAAGKSVTVQGEVSSGIPGQEPPTIPQSIGTADTQSNPCLVIERQMQLMAQQLEMLRRRAAAGK